MFESTMMQLFDPGRLPVAILALLIVVAGGLAAGAVQGRMEPIFWRAVEAVFGPLGRRLDRRHRAHGDLVLRGFFLCVLALAACLTLGAFVQGQLAGFARGGAGDSFASLARGIEGAVLALLLSAGAPGRELWRLHRALAEKTVGEGAYYALAVSARVNLSGADDYTVTRTAMGFVARLFDKGVVAPLFWYLIGGLPLAFAYAGLASLSHRFGREGFGRSFALSILALEKLLGCIPGFLAGLLLALAALFTPTAQMSRGLKGLGKMSGSGAYSQGGLPLAALAWGLNVSLGGPVNDLEGRTLKRGWIGPPEATARLEPRHVYRALYMAAVACLLLLAALVGAIVISGNSLLDF